MRPSDLFAHLCLGRLQPVELGRSRIAREQWGVLRRAGCALGPANRLCRADGAVADAIDGDGARPRRTLCELSTQAVV